MSKNNPYCPICKGRGWYEGPYYGHLQPTIEMQACPNCNEVSKPTRGEVVFLAVGFVVLFVLMIAGAR